MTAEINRSQPDSDRLMTPSEQVAYERGYAEAEQATIDFMLTSQRNAAEIPQQLPQRTRRSIISLFSRSKPHEKNAQESADGNVSLWNRALQSKVSRRAAIATGLTAVAGSGYFLPRVVRGTIERMPSAAQAEGMLLGSDPSESAALRALSYNEEVLPPSTPTSSESETETAMSTDTLVANEQEEKTDLSKMKKDVFESLNLPFYIDRDTLWFTEEDLKILLNDQSKDTAVSLSVSYSVGKAVQTWQHQSEIIQLSVLIKDPPTLLVEKDFIANHTFFLPEIKTPYGRLYGIKGFNLGNQTLVAEFADYNKHQYGHMDEAKEEKRFAKPIQLESTAEVPEVAGLEDELRVIDHAKIDPSVLKNDIYPLANDFNSLFAIPQIWRIVITDEISPLEPVSVQESDKKVLFVHSADFPPDGPIRVDKPGSLRLCARLVDLLADSKQPHSRAIESTLSSLNTALSEEVDAYYNEDTSSNPQQSTPVAHFTRELLEKEKIKLPNYVDTTNIADYGVYVSAINFLREFIPLAKYKPQQVRDYVESLDPAQQESAKSYMTQAFTIIRQIAHSYYPSPASAEEAFHNVLGGGVTKELIKFAGTPRQTS